MRCHSCESDAVHELQFLDGAIPLCRQHLLRAFRRFRPGDKEALKYRCEEIIAGWEVQRKHKNRSKVDDSMLKQITEYRCSGLNIPTIAKTLGIAKSLVHRYVTKLEDLSA